MKQFLSIPGWDNFQHYSDRAAIWIKIYARLLSDYQFSDQINDSEKAQLFCLWLLASQTGNFIPYDIPWIKRKTGLKKVNIERLLSIKKEDGTPKWLQLAITPLASRENNTSETLEREREIERDREIERRGIEYDERDLDPLANYPLLIALHQEFREFICLLYPKQKEKMPKPGSSAYRKERAVLSQLIRLDKYSEDEIVNVIRWVFTSPDADAEFWRGNVQAIIPLRKAKTGELNKFAKIEAAMNRPGNTAPGATVGTYGEAPRFGREDDDE